MPDPTQSEKTPAIEQALELYPGLSHYFSVFDPEELIIYPPPPWQESASRNSVGQNKLKLIAVALIPLLIASVIIIIFILTGITAVPELGSG